MDMVAPAHLAAGESAHGFRFPIPKPRGTRNAHLVRWTGLFRRCASLSLLGKLYPSAAAADQVDRVWVGYHQSDDQGMESPSLAVSRVCTAKDPIRSLPGCHQ